MDALRDRGKPAFVQDQIAQIRQMEDWKNAKGVQKLQASVAAEAILELKRQGWRVLQLPAAITSKDDFFDAIRQSVPLDPPLQSNRSWEALADSFWSGLDGMNEERILIFWPDAAHMQAASPKDFQIATGILSSTSVSLADPEATLGQAKQVVIVQEI